jgi:hypothetical protein
MRSKLARLFSGWAVPGWVVVLFWLLVALLDWSDRIGSLRDKFAVLAPALQRPFALATSPAGQVTILVIGLTLLFIATWRKEAPPAKNSGEQQTVSSVHDSVPRGLAAENTLREGTKAERRKLGGLTPPRSKEWERLRTDFEAAARVYHDVEMNVVFLTQKKAAGDDEFPQPHYAINLWQFFGALPDEQTHSRIRNMKLTKFGLSGAELTAMAVITGSSTDLFRKMATRAGTLLPNAIGTILLSELSKRIQGDLAPAKPVFVTNHNGLAKWLNLMLLVTSTWHPERFRNFKLQVDPFAASLAVFDEFDAAAAESDEGLQPRTIGTAIKSAAPFARAAIGETFIGSLVEWSLDLRQVLKNSGENDVHLVFETGDHFPLVIVDTSTTAFPFLKAIHEGSKILVSGRVAAASEFEIHLTDTTLTPKEPRYQPDG